MQCVQDGLSGVVSVGSYILLMYGGVYRVHGPWTESGIEGEYYSFRSHYSCNCEHELLIIDATGFSNITYFRLSPPAYLARQRVLVLVLLLLRSFLLHAQPKHQRSPFTCHAHATRQGVSYGGMFGPSEGLGGV
jgi:hypothetical protein